MSENKSRITQVAESDGYVYFQYANTLSPNAIRADHEGPLRRALNERHKERKAAKKAERRFYVEESPERGTYWVRDRDADGDVHGSHWLPGCAEADAKAFAKLLNKRNRAPMGGERDG